jgi:hypothetical protein
MTWPIAKAKFERLAAIDARIELGAVDEPTGVMHRHELPCGRGIAAAGREVFNDEFGHDCYEFIAGHAL